MSTSKAQKEKMMSEFMALTNAIPADTARICKKVGYRLELAIDAFYRDLAAQTNAERSVKSKKRALSEEIENLLDIQFDLYQDGEDGTKMEMEGLLKYLESLNLSPEEPSVICLAHFLKAPKLGIIERSSFKKSWIKIYLNQPTLEHVDTQIKNLNKIHNLESLIHFQKNHINTLNDNLSQDANYFGLVYKFVFDFAKDEGQKSFALDTAIAFWEMLIPIAPLDAEVEFKPEYLEWWLDLLKSKGKAISRDTWNMFWDFVEQFDDGFVNYDESAAWPSVIDDFVECAREKLKALESMDTS
ncbi:hypothetical protein CROQUDRAFT_660097 [Cronartium quercuum f. sp. fusiforme G11]|uniref:Defective in cullin neddylation protein n=1 Tax=Cronartium quercuum f. sp. fusiforme G11 TaxID=708437 RepID=A0A9P6NEW3_9BASI|nr:hypothetical protein CROQUDRAFT_660097 [Cronartium quercuum f. sp. fusiforme G11]